MMTIITRLATPSDIDTLLAFEKGIIAAERPYDTTLREGEIHYYDLLELIQSPDAGVIVAVVNEQLVGSGYAKITEAKPYLKHTHYAHLGFMYVEPSYRGKGVNQMILDALIAWAKTKHINEVRLKVYNDNLPAKNAYTKAGFVPNLLEMRKEI